MGYTTAIFIPTEEQRGMVRMGVSAGIPLHILSQHIINPMTNRPIGCPTLLKYFREDIDHGKLHMKAFVVGKLFKLIQDGVPSAIYFYLKTQCHWKEPSADAVNVTDPSEVAAGLRQLAALMEQRTYGTAEALDAVASAPSGRVLQ